MEIELQEEPVKERISKLGNELHKERVDRYEVERCLNRVGSLKDDIITRTSSLGPRDRGTLIPLIQTIQDDLYKLQGSAWRSVYLSNKRNRSDEEMVRLKRELYYVEKDSVSLLDHVNEADRLIKQLTPKQDTTPIGAAIVLIAMSGFMFSSFQSYRIFVKPYTGLSILPSLGLLVYFIFATALVLSMFVLLFKMKKK
ncbi:MAG: hypothetical protein HY361_00460 [Candidatus Aenigmarchaeota archaeon]|nr:hypothetical protein [Candidatus Aenigmarchaeota archaeon]